LARWFGVPFAEGTGHTLANVAEWLADLAVLMVLDAWLTRRLGERAEAPAPALPVLGPRPSLRALALVLWPVGLLLLGLAAWRAPTGTGDRAEQLPTGVAGYVLVPRDAATERRFQQNLPRWRELLGTDDFVYRIYRGGNGDWISLVALFHDTNWKSVHPPQICIQGSGMDIEQDDLVAAPAIGEHTAVNRIVARRRDNGRRFVTLSLFGTRTWASGSYAEFASHHFPLALWRQSESGFLLRVESPIGSGENVAQAERRCADFLAELVPSARQVLR
jgi:hypothetical protein